MEPVHPIETASYAIMNQLVDLSGWPQGARDVVARIIHATADESFASSVRIGADAVRRAVAGLAQGAPVVCDARMVVAGIPQVATMTKVECYLDRVSPVISSHATGAPDTGPDARRRTRSAAAVDAAVSQHRSGAIWVVGNAPTALERIVALNSEGQLDPVALIGLPVGYVGAAEAKERLWASPMRPIAITNTGRRGGSPVAAAALNALARLAGAQDAPK